MARPAIITRDTTALAEDELTARVFRTLGDPNRLRVIKLLAEQGELTQSELISKLGLTQSRASEHLACLIWCGFVASERRGRATVYRVADERAVTFVELGQAFVSDHGGALNSCQVLSKRTVRDA
jgi:ArsR family transcriptional regulator